MSIKLSQAVYVLEIFHLSFDTCRIPFSRFSPNISVVFRILKCYKVYTLPTESQIEQQNIAPERYQTRYSQVMVFFSDFKIADDIYMLTSAKNNYANLLPSHTKIALIFMSNSTAKTNLSSHVYHVIDVIIIVVIIAPHFIK